MLVSVKLKFLPLSLSLSPLCFSQDTFQDYQEMFVQFGYVVLFSSAFPLAAMCALINNIIEIRSDAFKLCTGLQRPFGIRVESIGQWQVREVNTHIDLMLEWTTRMCFVDDALMENGNHDNYKVCIFF